MTIRSLVFLTVAGTQYHGSEGPQGLEHQGIPSRRRQDRPRQGPVGQDQELLQEVNEISALTSG